MRVGWTCEAYLSEESPGKLYRADGAAGAVPTTKRYLGVAR